MTEEPRVRDDSWALRVVAWIKFAAAIVCLLSVPILFLKEQAFRRDGVPVTAQVIAVEPAQDHVRLRLVFTDTTDRPRHASERLSADEYDQLGRPETLEIVYLPDDPAKIRVAGASSMWWIGGALAPAFFVMGLMVLSRAKARRAASRSSAPVA